MTANANTYSGRATVMALSPTFYAHDRHCPFGTGPLTLTGGVLTSNATPVTIANPVNLNGAFTFAGNSATETNIFTGPVTLTSNAFLSVNINGAGPGGTVFFDGTISGPYAVVMAGGTAGGSNVAAVFN